MLINDQLNQDIFSVTEKVIINFILGNLDSLETMTTTAIAETTHTNITSIVRIAKKLDFSGWTELKKQLIIERDYLAAHVSDIDVNKPFSTKDNARSISYNIGTLMKESIDDSLKLIDFNKLKYVCRMIYNSKRIMIFTAKNNLNIISGFISNMRRLKYDVQISDAFDYPEFEAYNMSSDTIGLFISYSGENPVILNCLNFVSKNKVKTVSITNANKNTLADSTMYNLKLATQEKLYSKIGSFNSSTSLIFLLNSIYSIIFSMDYDKNFEHIKAINKQMETRNSHTEPLKEEFES